MDENKIKSVTAKNIAEYRKNLNLTQFELAKKLNYSDKSISKWERAEAIPDAVILKQLADLFGITVDTLMSDSSFNIKKAKPPFRKRKIIPVMSVVLAFFVATIIFCLLKMFIPSISKPWLAFIFAVPASAIVLIIFSAMWNKRIINSLSVSLLNWSIALVLFLMVNLDYTYSFFFIAAVFQILILLWYYLKKQK